MPAKRKIESILGRRVRPRVEKDVGPVRDVEEDEFEGFGEDDRSEDGSEGGSDVESQEEDNDEDDTENEDSAPEEEPAHDFSKVTFGQLARAQASLPPKARKHDVSSEPAPSAPPPPPDRKSFGKRNPPPSRSSKHAPAEVSSKRAVKRAPSSLSTTVATTSAGFVPRDPRFDPAILSRVSSAPTSDDKARRAYSFLDEYRTRETREMRSKLTDKKVPEGEKEKIRRELAKLDSRKRARARKELEQKVRDEHRARERELATAQGKKPYFLKKAELRKRVLTEQFAGMSEKQAERAVERRRKKVAGKEKKQMGELERRR